MKRLFTRALAIALAVIMATAGAAFPISAATFSDTQSHWSNDYVEYMYKKSILNGYPDGTFRPDNQVTRAEFIKMLDETFGLTDTTSISYLDVPASEWFYTYIAKAAAQGYLISYGSYLNPNGELTRAEAAALLVRYLGLPSNESVSSSYYPDYSSINSSYRAYVLQATYAGLFKGYEDGAFRPSNTLTRAEAMTILYRAAGSIYSVSTSGRDSGANTENAVITKSGVTVTNAALKGNVIISEGASSGTVTLSGCTLDGTLYVRGKVKVALANCDIDKIIVDAESGYTVNLTLSGGTEIGEMLLESSSNITLNTGNTISALEVLNTASDSRVTGTGTIKSAIIRAGGFTATQIPVKYEITNGLSAEFAGSSFTGSSTASNGFVSTPRAEQSSGYEYLYYTPAASGTVKYYYTTAASAPTSSSAFTGAYNAASSAAKGSFTATAGTENSNRTGTASSLTAYTYVVLMLSTNGSDYLPVIVARGSTSASASAAGFAATPTISQTNGYDYLAYTPLYAGSIQYYYTNDSMTPSSSSFGNYYYSATYKGTLTATASQAKSNALANSVNAGAYNYVVLMLTSSSNNKYQPLVLSRAGGGAAASGFSSAPTLGVSGQNEFISFATTLSGTLYYYYTTTSGTPTSSSFNTNWSSAAYSGSFSVSGSSGQQSGITKQTSYVSSMPYAVVMFKDNSGTYYTPYVISRAGGSASASGFTTTPTVTSDGSNDKITVSATANGIVYYYYTTTSATPTSLNYSDNYSAATYKGSVDLSSVTSASQNTVYSGYVTGYNYIAIMFVDSANNYYTPTVVTRGAASASGTGFTTVPTVSQSGSYDYLSYNASTSGTCYYYYTSSPTQPTSATFSNYYGAASYYGTFPVNTSSLGSASAQLKYSSYVTGTPYVVLMISDATGTKLTPVVVNRTGGSTSGSGFTTTPTVTQTNGYDYLSYTANTTGTCYYYYTNTPTAPTSGTFSTGYNGAGVSYAGTFSLSTGTLSTSAQLKYSNNVTGYNYIVLMAVNSAGTYMTPVVVSRSGSLNTSGTGFSSTPTLTQSGGYDYLSYAASVTGTCYYYYTNTSTIPTTSTFSTGYNNTSYRGSFAVSTSGLLSSSAQLQSYSTASSFNYVVLMIQQNNVTYLTPVVISRGGSTVSGSGFSSTPTISQSGSYDYVYYSATTAGTCYYYYTNSASVPNSTTFSNTHGNTNSSYKGSFAVTTSSLLSTSAQLKYYSYVSGYNYLAMMIVDSSGTYMAPIVISRDGAMLDGNSGFNSMPTLTSNGSYDVLSYTTSVSGTCYYYYTTISTAPTTTAFSTNLQNTGSSYKGSFAVSASSLLSTSAQLKYSSNVSAYDYVVLMIAQSNGTYLTPVVVSRDGGTSATSGFTTSPTISTVASYDRLSYKTTYSGSVYYYYTKSSSVPSTSTYEDFYNSAAYRDVFSATAGTAKTQNLIYASYAEEYPYVAVRFVSSGGTKYQPILISRSGGTAAAEGFSSAPTVSVSGGYEHLNYTTSATGTVYYYYTNTASTPTAANYNSYYTSATYHSNFSASAGSSDTNRMITSANASGYSYIVVQFVDVSSTRYTPVLISRSGSSSTTSNGFTTVPTHSVLSGNDRISYKATYGGTLWYYYTNTATAPNQDTFNTTYGNTASAYRGQLPVTAGSNATSTLNDADNSYGYIVVMLVSGSGTSYYPVVVTKAASDSSSSGFSTVPTYGVAGNYDRISYTPSVSGTLYYYYTNTTSTPSQSGFETALNSASTSLKGSMSVDSGIGQGVNLKLTSSVASYKYIVVMIKSANTRYSPVMVERTATSASGFDEDVTMGIVAASGSHWLKTYKALSAGTVQYYYANSATAPSATAFATNYSAADTAIKGSFTVTANGTAQKQLKSVDDTAEYSYVVFRLGSGTPVVVALPD